MLAVGTGESGATTEDMEAFKSKRPFNGPLLGGSQVSNARPGAPIAFPVGHGAGEGTSFSGCGKRVTSEEMKWKAYLRA